MRLFHFSEEAGIEAFEPRPVLVPSLRPAGMDWLNGPLVWAIDAHHAPLYLFPRDCPRILIWATVNATQEDLDIWWRGSQARMIAFIEADWLERLRTTRLWRYAFAPEGFEDLRDAGMWVSRQPVVPIAVEPLGDLPAALAAENVDLRCLADLTPLRNVWDTSLHASGIRLRDARHWG